MVKKLIYIFLFLGLTTISYSGNSDKEKNNKAKIVSGKVTDVYGESLPGAKIMITETGETFFADLDGNFKLTLKPNAEYTLLIDNIGYLPTQVKANNLIGFPEVSLKPL